MKHISLVVIVSLFLIVMGCSGGTTKETPSTTSGGSTVETPQDTAPESITSEIDSVDTIDQELDTSELDTLESDLQDLEDLNI